MPSSTVPPAPASSSQIFTDAEKLQLLEELIRTHVFDIDWSHVRLPSGHTIYESFNYIKLLRTTAVHPATKTTATLQPPPQRFSPVVLSSGPDSSSLTIPPPAANPYTPAPGPPGAPVPSPAGNYLITPTSYSTISNANTVTAGPPSTAAASGSTPRAAAAAAGPEGVVKRKRGRPRKYPAVEENGEPPLPKRGRGRPRKNPIVETDS